MKFNKKKLGPVMVFLLPVVAALVAVIVVLAPWFRGRMAQFGRWYEIKRMPAAALPQLGDPVPDHAIEREDTRLYVSMCCGHADAYLCKTEYGVFWLGVREGVVMHIEPVSDDFGTPEGVSVGMPMTEALSVADDYLLGYDPYPNFLPHIILPSGWIAAYSIGPDQHGHMITNVPMIAPDSQIVKVFKNATVHDGDTRSLFETESEADNLRQALGFAKTDERKTLADAVGKSRGH